MTPKPCSKCNKELPVTASYCPSCGTPTAAEVTATRIGCLFVIALILFVLISSWMDQADRKHEALNRQFEESKRARNETPEQARERKIKHAFSPWNGGHYALVKLTKDSMNDPKSFEHVNTQYWDMKEHLVVRMDFRGKNAFGGMVKNFIIVKTTVDGKILEIINQGP
jgi:hypothetical protein